MPAVSRARPATAGRHLGVRLDRELEASLQLVVDQLFTASQPQVRELLHQWLELA